MRMLIVGLVAGFLPQSALPQSDLIAPQPSVVWTELGPAPISGANDTGRVSAVLSRHSRLTDRTQRSAKAFMFGAW